MGIEARKIRLNQMVRGWMNYFKLADARKLIQGLDAFHIPTIFLIFHPTWLNSCENNGHLFKSAHYMIVVFGGYMSAM